MKYTEDQAKEVIEKISVKMNLSKKVKNVRYNGQRLHYFVSFDDDSSCVVQRKHMDDYIDSEGKDGERAIMNCLSIVVKFTR